jgi:type III secretion system YscQ/HrcQ family protein
MTEWARSTSPGLPRLGGGGRPPTGASTRKGWKKYAFPDLEKISRAQALLTERLAWLMPSAGASETATAAIQERLKELFEDDVQLILDHVTVKTPDALRRLMGDPTFLAVLVPAPQKTRGLLEVELGLAHAAIDKLLGGSGEAAATRRLTDIEDGVMEFIILEALKTLAPNLEPGLPRVRLEGMARTVDEGLRLLQDEEVVVVQLKSTLGPQVGFLRVFIPASVVGMTNPPGEGPERRARRRLEIEKNAARLSGVKTWLRAEIGRAEVNAADVARLGSGDVVLVDELTARPDQGQGGTARVKVGKGKAGWFDAEILVEEGKFKAKVSGFQLGDEPRHTEEPGVGNENQEGAEGEAPQEEAGAADGADLINDIPLQIVVELARIPVTAEQVVQIKVGQVIDLNRVPGEPVEMSVNGKVVARGELVEVEGHLGVRILSLMG